MCPEYFCLTIAQQSPVSCKSCYRSVVAAKRVIRVSDDSSNITVTILTDKDYLRRIFLIPQDREALEPVSRILAPSVCSSLIFLGAPDPCSGDQDYK